jgi:uncharacterized protein (TIGR00162 family)
LATTLRVYEQPMLSSPVMIAGLPGIGSVAWLVVNHLVRQLKAELFAEIYSPSFSPKVRLAEDGTVKLVKGDFHFAKAKGTGDLVFFTASEQPHSPEGQYELAERVLEFAEKLAVKRLLTMGGMATDRFTDAPKVYGGSTDLSLMSELEKHGVFKLVGGSITGTNGLLFGLAKPRNIQAICLLAETPGYLSFDAAAARAVLQVMSKLVGIQVDMSSLEQQAKENKDAVERSKEPGKGWGRAETRRPVRDRELPYVS